MALPLNTSLPFEKGAEALFFAIEQNRPYAVSRLLESGVSPDSRPPKNDRFSEFVDSPALSFASTRDFDASEIIETLLDAGARVDERDRFGRTPLATALCFGKHSAARLLVRRGARLDAVSVCSHALIHEALIGGNLDCVSLVLSLDPAQIDAREEDGIPPLSFSASFPRKSSHVSLARLLIDAGADVEANDDEGQTPLHFFAAHSEPESLELLVRAGADVDALTIDGFSPLHFAARHAKTRSVETLLSLGASVENSFHARSPLHDALDSDDEKASTESMELLLRAGSHPDYRDIHSGSTPIMKAVFEGRISAVRLLLEFGADPLALDSQSRGIFDYSDDAEFLRSVRAEIERFELERKSEAGLPRSRKKL